MKKIISLMIALCIIATGSCIGTVQAKEVGYTAIPLLADIHIDGDEDYSWLDYLELNGNLFLIGDDQKSVYDVKNDRIIKRENNTLLLNNIFSMDGKIYYMYVTEQGRLICDESNGYVAEFPANDLVINPHINGCLFRVYNKNKDGYRIYSLKTKKLSSEVYKTDLSDDIAGSVLISKSGTWAQSFDDNKWYWINNNGEKTNITAKIPANYYIYHVLDADNDLYRFGEYEPFPTRHIVSPNSGIIDKNGNVIFEIKEKSTFEQDGYTGLGFGEEGLALVRKLDNNNDIYGFVDRNGQMAIPFIYKYAEPFINGLAKVYNGQEEYYIDKNNQRMPDTANYKVYESVVENYTEIGVKDTKSGDTIYLKKDGFALYIIGKKQEYIFAEKNGKMYKILFEENKKEFSGIRFNSSTYTYDGTEKKLAISGTLPSGASVAYTNEKGTNAGTYNATATVTCAGYEDLTLKATLTINPKNLTIAGLSANNKTYDGTDKAMLSGGTLSGKVGSDDVSAAIPTEGKFSDKNVGNNKAVSIGNITLSGAKKDNYMLTQPTGLKANITQKEISVTADNQQMIKNSAMPKLTYTADTLFGEDKFSGVLATRADGKKVGTFDITQGTLTAGNNYKINFTKGTLTVSDKTPQTADVSAVSEKTYGDSSFTVSVTNDSVPSLGNFTFESSNTDVSEITADGVITIKNAGETNITVKRDGNDTYAPFEKTQKLVVKKVPITVTADAKTKKVGAADPELTYTYTGDLVGADAFTGELTRQPGEEIGKYDILQGTLTLGDNYDITYNKAVFEILDKTPQTITVAVFGEKTYGDGEFAISVTPDSASNLTSFTYASDNEAVATVSADGKITIKGAGEANITVTEAGNSDYAAATVTKKLTVNKKALNIKVDDVTVTYGGKINTNITYDGFISGEDETVLTKPVAVSGYSKKPNAGEYDIVLNGAEAANYEIAYTNAKLIVNKKNITVTALKVFDKAADETTAATINNSTLVFDGVIFGDDVTIDLANASAAFAQTAAGDDIAVTITGLALTGADAANYNLTNNEISTTASIKDSITAADIAAQINALTVVKDAEAITLPSVPAGYKLTVKSSDNEAVIKTDGSVAPVANDTNVVLVLEVANENDETDVADTDEITVTVPASTTVTVTAVAGENGTVTGTGDYLKNAQATVTATPNSGYNFDGWYNGETKVSTSTAYTFKVENDITLTAKFARRSSGGGSSVSSYTVKFETNGGSKVSSQSVSKNSTVKEPTAPTKDGFEFAGWYSDKDLKTKYDFSDKVTKSITLYAAWTEKKAETTDPTDKPSTPETKGKFTDVNDRDWFSENVKYVFENGLMSGVSENKFAPNDNLTRAMLVTILYRAAGEPEVNKSVPFADVKADSYYANAVIWAQQNGIVSGVSENEFAPDTNITREQIATIMFRYAKEKGYDVSVGESTNILSHTDVEDISEYAIEAMQYAVGSGLIKGKSETTLNPKDTATRAEIATILQRFIEGNK